MVPKVKNEKESTLGILKASDIMAEVCRGGRSSLNHQTQLRRRMKSTD